MMILMSFWEWFVAPFKKGQYELTFLDEMQIMLTILVILGIIFGILMLLIYLNNRR